MGTWLDSACLCFLIVSSAAMAAGVYAAQGVELVLQRIGPITGEKLCAAHRYKVNDALYKNVKNN